jgi:hypothetical protein
MAHYAKHRERLKAYQRDYQRTNRQRVCERAKRWREKNAEVLRSKRAALRDAKPDVLRTWKRRDYDRHKDAYKARAIRHWFRKQYPTLSSEHIELLVLTTEFRRKLKEARSR